MKKTTYSNLPFFVELIINLFFFLFVSTILISIFAKIILFSEQIQAKNLAISEMYAISEIVKAEGVSVLPTVFEESETSYWIYYDENWKLTNETPLYKVNILLKNTPQEAGTLTDLTFIAYSSQNDDELYQFFTGYYRPNKGVNTIE